MADVITLLRIAGTLVLTVFEPLHTAFLSIYALTGVTDVLDGYIARKTHSESAFGARLDSAADLLFYAVMLVKILPILWDILPVGIWYAVGGVVILRLTSYLTAALKYRLFASMHTYMNKLTGAVLFIVPFMLLTEIAVGYCIFVCAVAAAAAVEELAIHITCVRYHADTKTIFQSESTKEWH